MSIVFKYHEELYSDGCIWRGDTVTGDYNKTVQYKDLIGGWCGFSTTKVILNDYMRQSQSTGYFDVSHGLKNLTDQMPENGVIMLKNIRTKQFWVVYQKEGCEEVTDMPFFSIGMLQAELRAILKIKPDLEPREIAGCCMTHFGYPCCNWYKNGSLFIRATMRCSPSLSTKQKEEDGDCTLLLTTDPSSGKSTVWQRACHHTIDDLKIVTGLLGCTSEAFDKEEKDAERMFGPRTYGYVANNTRNYSKWLATQQNPPLRMDVVKILEDLNWLTFKSGEFISASLLNISKSNRWLCENLSDPKGHVLEFGELSETTLFIRIMNDDGTITNCFNLAVLSRCTRNFWWMDGLVYIMLSEGAPRFPLRFGYAHKHIDSVGLSGMAYRHISNTLNVMIGHVLDTGVGVTETELSKAIEQSDPDLLKKFLELERGLTRYEKVSTENPRILVEGCLHDLDITALTLPLLIEPSVIDSFQSAVLGNTARGGAILGGGLDKALLSTLSDVSRSQTILTYPSMSDSKADLLTAWDAMGAFDGTLIIKASKEEHGKDGWLINRSIGYTTRAAGKTQRSAFFYLYQITSGYRRTFGGRFMFDEAPEGIILRKYRQNRYSDEARIPDIEFRKPSQWILAVPRIKDPTVNTKVKEEDSSGPLVVEHDVMGFYRRQFQPGNINF